MDTENIAITTLGTICEIIAGQSPEGRFYNKKGEGLPFYQGKKEFSQKFIGQPKIWTTVATKVAYENDILISVRAPVGPVNFATQKACIGRGLAIIRGGNKINKDYLFHFLQFNEKKIVGNLGAVFSSITKRDIENIEISLPSLSRQQAIVSHLDALFSQAKRLEEIYKQKLVTLEELKKSILNKAFAGEL